MNLPDTQHKYIAVTCSYCDGKGFCEQCGSIGKLYRLNYFYGTWALDLKPILNAPWFKPKKNTNWNVGLGHWQWGAAYHNPDTWQFHDFTENNAPFQNRSYFRKADKLLFTNIAGCPWWSYHHIGSQCEICKADERHIRPIGKRKK